MSARVVHAGKPVCCNCGYVITNGEPTRTSPGTRYWTKDWRQMCALCAHTPPK